MRKLVSTKRTNIEKIELQSYRTVIAIWWLEFSHFWAFWANIHTHNDTLYMTMTKWFKTMFSSSKAHLCLLQSGHKFPIFRASGGVYHLSTHKGELFWFNFAKPEYSSLQQFLSSPTIISPTTKILARSIRDHSRNYGKIDYKTKQTLPLPLHPKFRTFLDNKIPPLSRKSTSLPMEEN